MYTLILLVHVLVCVFLIIVVLLQSGKAADLAGAFGGMGSQTAFGPRGSATLLSKATTVSAILFMVTSLSLSIMATRNAGLGTTVLEGTPQGRPIPTKTQQAPIPAPGGSTPIPVSPQGGQPQQPGTIQIPIPAQPPAQAPAQPAPAKK
jgi:preprotein translocase subunit SecG